MYTEKADRYHGLTRELTELIGDGGCLVCGASHQATVDKIVDTLSRYDIDPQAVAAEMRTLNGVFDFVEGWKSHPQRGCYLNTTDFFAVCYKFLK